MAASPTETLNEYVRAFETLDPKHFVSYYNLRCIFITLAATTAATDAAAVRALADVLVRTARQYSFKSTEFVSPLDCRMLSDTWAVLSGLFRRFDSSDQVILELGFAYVMQLPTTDGRWSLWRRMRCVHSAHAVGPVGTRDSSLNLDSLISKPHRVTDERGARFQCPRGAIERHLAAGVQLLWRGGYAQFESRNPLGISRQSGSCCLTGGGGHATGPPPPTLAEHAGMQALRRSVVSLVRCPQCRKRGSIERSRLYFFST